MSQDIHETYRYLLNGYTIIRNNGKLGWKLRETYQYWHKTLLPESFLNPYVIV